MNPSTGDAGMSSSAMLVRIIKDWDWPDLLRQTPGGCGRWGGMDFTLEAVPRCDVAVMLNNRIRRQVEVTCPDANIWMLVQEPYHPGFTDWVVEGHAPFSRVFTHLARDFEDGKYVVSPPAIPWHVDKTYDELVAAKIPAKTSRISWIMGNAQDLPGHIARRRFFDFVRFQSSVEVALYGRAIQPVADKWDALAPFFFSIAVENNSGPHMWTEKLADCFLSWTVPFYYGCTNLEEYFPPDAFIRIDINDPAAALEKIRSLATPAEWEKRLPALEQARRLVLERYQLFPLLCEHIARYGVVDGASPSLHQIPPYSRSLAARVKRLGYKIKKRFGR